MDRLSPAIVFYKVSLKILKKLDKHFSGALNLALFLNAFHYLIMILMTEEIIPFRNRYSLHKSNGVEDFHTISLLSEIE